MLCQWISLVLINVVFCDFNRVNEPDIYEDYDVDPRFQEIPTYGPRSSNEARGYPRQSNYRLPDFHDDRGEKSATARRPILRIPEPMGKPSPGMEMYWAQEKPEINQQRSGPLIKIPPAVSRQRMMDMALNKIKVLEEEEKSLATKSTNPTPTQPSFNPDPMAGSDMVKMMMKQIQHLENQLKEKNQPKTESPKILAGFPLEEKNNILRETNITVLQNQKNIFKDFPRVDDFDSPIRWVKMNSNETEDGLAKITDPETGRNRQYLVNGVFYVPVADYRVERLGITTPATTLAPLLSTEKSVLRTVMASMNVKLADERDWLAFEAIVGGDQYEPMCDGDGCQSRCKTMACQTMCNGDTCSTGCVGPACSSYCKGPGCLTMCIGERCSARCEGLSCDSRCRGKNCEANCNQFSCYYTVNGAMNRGEGNFNQWYPERG